MKKNKIYIKSYGCQMNVYDSNRILDLFKNKNYEVSENPKDADLVVLNTCHIREKAAEKVYSDIGRINKIKKNKSKERIDLDGTIDILNYIGKNNQHRPKLVIGFSAETEKLLHNSKIKLKNKNADWIIANDISKKDIGFNKDYNAVTIIRSDGKVSQIKKNKKSFIASIISGEIIKKLLINDKSLN